MDTIEEALRHIYRSEQISSPEKSQWYMMRAQALAIIAVAERLEALTDKLPDKELSNTKRIVITVNDDTSRINIDRLCEYIQLDLNTVGITAVIVYEEGKDE